jgi:hypothetical protein
MELIEQNWDDILRLIATIMLKKNHRLGNLPATQFLAKDI